jgi:hypothetical protein
MYKFQLILPLHSFFLLACSPANQQSLQDHRPMLSGGSAEARAVQKQLLPKALSLHQLKYTLPFLTCPLAQAFVRLPSDLSLILQ